MNTTENNKLIAEFMDMKVSTDGTQVKDENWFYVDLDSTFNTSWDWLMPVVDKIEQVHEWLEGCDGVPQELINLSLFSTIDEVYNAVVEFINQYNK